MFESATVLVVDDDRDVADLFAEYLADRYDVRTAYGGDEALDALDDEVDVMLLDRRMPGTSGDEVLATVRERRPDLQVVMVTGTDPDFDIIEIGFDGYVIKPVMREELLGAVEQTLARARYESYIEEYYALAAERSRIESTTAADPEDDEAYADVTGRLEDLEDRIDALLSRFEGPGFAATIERTQTVAALRESEERYRSLTEDALDSSDVGTVIIDADGRVVWLNEAIERAFGIGREAAVGDDYSTVVRERIANAVADGETFEDRVLDALSENASVEEFPCRVPGDGARPERFLRHWSKPIEAGLYAGGRIEHYYDVTALKDRERTLEALHGATRDLIHTDATDEIGAVTVEAAREVLGFPAAVLYLQDESTGELSPVASGFEDDVDGEPGPIAAGDGPIWETFVGGVADCLPADRVAESGLAAEGSAGRALVLPLGTHGVVVLCDGETGPVSEADATFAHVLAANVEVTLDRTERERAIRDRDERLERQNARLERLNRINTVVRGIGRALVAASSRDEIEQAVCARLASIESYRFVWMGRPDAVDGTVAPRARAGDDDGYLESVPLSTAERRAERHPGWEAVQTHEPQTIGNLVDGTTSNQWRSAALEGASQTSRWRSAALDRGYQSVAAVPVTYEESVYGVIEIYADRPGAFDDEERAVLSELGETIGHAIAAVDRKDALVADSFVELEFEVGGAPGSDGSGGFLVDLAAESERAVDLRAAIPQSDGTYLVFFAVEDVPEERVAELADRAVGVDEATAVRDGPGERLFKCHMDDVAVVTTAADRGAVPTAVTAGDGACRVTVTLPRSSDVRAFADRLSDRHPDASLVARRDRADDGHVIHAVNERIDDRLTDRQREALRSAYFSGYFEWPRETTGEGVAEALGIDQSTLQQHLRAGERHVFEALFDQP